MTKQPISGVSPATLTEVTSMTVWPSLAATAYGRWWGRMFANSFGPTICGIPITLGRILALVSIPFILPAYFHMLVPRLPLVLWGIRNRSCQRYRLTNRRVIVEHFLGGEPFRSVSLDRFDSIRVDVRPGQDWYKAGDLIFFQGPTETFRLEGVPRPETFRQTCLKAAQSYAGVGKARKSGQAV